MQQYPWFYYEVFLNPNFLYDDSTARTVQAKRDSDPSSIKKFLDGYSSFANLTRLFMVEKINDDGQKIKVPSEELKALIEILRKHIVMQMLPKQITLRMESKIENHIKFVEGDFYAEMKNFKSQHPQLFTRAFGDFLQQKDSFFVAAQDFGKQKSMEHVLSFSSLAPQKIMNQENVKEYSYMNINIVTWFAALDLEKGTYQERDLLANVKEKNSKLAVRNDANKAAAENKIICITALKKAMLDMDVTAGSMALEKLKNTSANEKTYRFLDTLIMVAQTELLAKLAAKNNIDKITPQNYNKLLAELEILPFKEQLSNDNNLLADAINDAQRQVTALRAYINLDHELPTLELLTDEDKKQIKQLYPGRDSASERELLDMDEEIKKILLTDSAKKESYAFYKDAAFNSSLNYSSALTKLALMEAKLAELEKIKGPEKTEGEHKAPNI